MILLLEHACIYYTRKIKIFQGMDLRQYSKQIEKELKEVENASIQDCILYL